MTNDTNNFAKRTASQVRALLAKNGLFADVINDGDGNHFSIYCEQSIKSAYIIKKAGLIRISKSSAGYNVKCH